MNRQQLTDTLANNVYYDILQILRQRGIIDNNDPTVSVEKAIYEFLDALERADLTDVHCPLCGAQHAPDDGPAGSITHPSRREPRRKDRA